MATDTAMDSFELRDNNSILKTSKIRFHREMMINSDTIDAIPSCIESHTTKKIRDSSLGKSHTNTELNSNNHVLLNISPLSSVSTITPPLVLPTAPAYINVESRDDFLYLPDTTISPMVNTRIDKSIRKASCNSPWTNIFATMKLVVSMRMPSSVDVPDSLLDLCIRFADNNFEKNFKFSSTAIKNHCIEILVGPGTSRVTLNKIKECMRSGQSCGEYINLYRNDMAPLCCFVNINILTDSLAVSCQSPLGERHIIGVMTIRSSSVVGNMSYTGFGLLPSHHISKEGKARILHEKVAMAQKSGSSK